MGDDERERDLEVLLSYLLNKQLKQGEVIVALGISRSTYYDQKTAGRLESPENLLAVAKYFNLNPIDLLIRYGHVNIEDILDFLENHPMVTTRKEGSRIAELHNSHRIKRHLGSGI